jgi:DNA-binding response OmpR family regulator
VDVHVRRLRSKLGDVGRSIATVRGVGYRFDFLQSRTRAAI